MIYRIPQSAIGRTFIEEFKHEVRYECESGLMFG